MGDPLELDWRSAAHTNQVYHRTCTACEKDCKARLARLHPAFQYTAGRAI